MSDFMLSRAAAITGTAASLVAMTQPAFAAIDPMPALIAAAKAEGNITIDGPPIDSVREALTKGFQSTYGIPVSYISGSATSGARVRAERAAGKYLLDVLVSGIDTPTLTFLPAGWLDKVEPVLVAPDVLDTKKWKDGHLWFEDDSNTILRVFQFVQSELAINTKFVKKGDFPTWKSLLDPKWQGKIVIKDPTITGAGASLISYFYLHYGPDFVKKLYKDQRPVVSRDARQSVQWLAEGNYPILVGPESTFIFQFQKLGYPILPLFPSDGPSVLTGGWGLVSLLNKAPHPNAAKLFINWIAGKKGGELYANANASVSLRTDVKPDALVPPFSFPQRGTKYMDTYNFKFVTEQRQPAFEKAREVLGE